MWGQRPPPVPPPYRLADVWSPRGAADSFDTKEQQPGHDRTICAGSVRGAGAGNRAERAGIEDVGGVGTLPAGGPVHGWMSSSVPRS